MVSADRRDSPATALQTGPAPARFQPIDGGAAHRAAALHHRRRSRAYGAVIRRARAFAQFCRRWEKTLKQPTHTKQSSSTPGMGERSLTRSDVADMDATDRSEILHILQERRETIIDRWYRAIAWTGFTSLSAADMRQYLLGLT